MKPKKPNTAWIFYNTEQVVKLKEKDGLSHKDAFAKSAEIWKTLKDNQKAKYEKMAKADEERYKKQLEELEKKGYFTNADGTKSTDMQLDPKKKFGKDVVLPKRPI